MSTPKAKIPLNKRQCKRCAQSFMPTYGNNVYCSHRCRRGWANCLECGVEYILNKHGSGKYCSRKCHYIHKRPIGTLRRDSSGYLIVKVPPGTPGAKRSKRLSHWMWAHRYVMQQKLGRPLKRHENVHHINGKRDDNRPENLELWKKAQAIGVRAADYHCHGCRCFEHERKRA